MRINEGISKLSSDPTNIFKRKLGANHTHTCDGLSSVRAWARQKAGPKDSFGGSAGLVRLAGFFWLDFFCLLFCVKTKK